MDSETNTTKQDTPSPSDTDAGLMIPFATAEAVVIEFVTICGNCMALFVAEAEKFGDPKLTDAAKKIRDDVTQYFLESI